MNDNHKINAMHRFHGRRGWGKCGDCRHFVSGRYHSRILCKCKVYGLTHSIATDWAKSWAACKLFDVSDITGLTLVMNLARVRKEDDATCDGQLSLL